jgi:hypothetical protein
MTQAEWLSCTDPRQMLDFLHGKASKRKLRLFAAAAWRLRCRDFTTFDDVRRVIAKAELMAEGEYKPRPSECYWLQLDGNVWKMAEQTVGILLGLRGRGQVPRVEQATLLRDIFAPFHSGLFDPSWRAWNGAALVNLAQTIYEERAFDRLPILADALEDAGCTNQELIAHCRGTGPHYRGCWAVDAVLAKG